MNADTLIVGFFAVLVLVAVAIALWPFRRNIPPAGWLALLAVFLALPAAAQRPNLKAGMLSGSETLIGFGDGASRHVIVFARGQADYGVGAKCVQPAIYCEWNLHVFARIEGSALGDGGTGGVNLQDPSSFTSLEMYGGSYYHVTSGVSVAGIAGGVMAIEKGIALATSAPKTYGGGLMFGDPSSGKWVLLAMGVHQASGPGTRLLFGLQYPIADRLNVVADGAVGGPRSFVRAGLAIKAGN